MHVYILGSFYSSMSPYKFLEIWLSINDPCHILTSDLPSHAPPHLTLHVLLFFLPFYSTAISLSCKKRLLIGFQPPRPE